MLTKEQTGTVDRSDRLRSLAIVFEAAVAAADAAVAVIASAAAAEVDPASDSSRCGSDLIEVSSLPWSCMMLPPSQRLLFELLLVLLLLLLQLLL